MYLLKKTESISNHESRPAEIQEQRVVTDNSEGKANVKGRKRKV